MKKLGLISKFQQRVDPIHFFDVNMKGFFEKFEVKFSSFSVQEAPEPISGNVLLIRQETDGFDAYMVFMDKTFVADLRSVADGDYVGTLWYNLIMHVRIWVVESQNVPISDLLPPRVLSDEMGDSEDIYRGIIEGYDQGHFNETDLARRFDSATIGLHVARIVAERPEKLSALSFEDLAELVLKARHGNWHKLIEDC